MPISASAQKWQFQNLTGTRFHHRQHCCVDDVIGRLGSLGSMEWLGPASKARPDAGVSRRLQSFYASGPCQSMRPRRDRLEHFAGKIMGAPSEIIDRDNSNHGLFSVHDGQSPHALILHQACRFLAVLIVKTVRHDARHDCSHGRLRRVLARANGATADIAIRDYAHGLAILPHRKHADAQLIHLLCALLNGGGGGDRL
jgi:hypothetical protein